MINDLNYYISVKKQDVSQEIVPKSLKSSIRKSCSENSVLNLKCHFPKKGCMRENYLFFERWLLNLYDIKK